MHGLREAYAAQSTVGLRVLDQEETRRLNAALAFFLDRWPRHYAEGYGAA